MPGTWGLWQGSVWSLSSGGLSLSACCGLDADFWSFDRISVVTSSCIWMEWKVFFASARICRWAAGPRTDGWIVLVDASSGAMLSAFVPVWGLQASPALQRARSQNGVVFEFFRWEMCHSCHNLNLWWSYCVAFSNFLSDMHRHTHTITYAYAGLPQIIFEVDELIYRFIYTACVCRWVSRIPWADYCDPKWKPYGDGSISKISYVGSRWHLEMPTILMSVFWAICISTLIHLVLNQRPKAARTPKKTVGAGRKGRNRNREV